MHFKKYSAAIARFFLGDAEKPYSIEIDAKRNLEFTKQLIEIVTEKWKPESQENTDLSLQILEKINMLYSAPYNAPPDKKTAREEIKKAVTRLICEDRKPLLLPIIPIDLLSISNLLELKKFEFITELLASRRYDWEHSKFFNQFFNQAHDKYLEHLNIFIENGIYKAAESMISKSFCTIITDKGNSYRVRKARTTSNEARHLVNEKIAPNLIETYRNLGKITKEKQSQLEKKGNPSVDQKALETEIKLIQNLQQKLLSTKALTFSFNHLLHYYPFQEGDQDLITEIIKRNVYIKKWSNTYIAMGERTNYRNLGVPFYTKKHTTNSALTEAVFLGNRPEFFLDAISKNIKTEYFLHMIEMIIKNNTRILDELITTIVLNRLDEKKIDELPDKDGFEALKSTETLRETEFNSLPDKLKFYKDQQVSRQSGKSPLYTMTNPALDIVQILTKSIDFLKRYKEKIKSIQLAGATKTTVQNKKETREEAASAADSDQTINLAEAERREYCAKNYLRNALEKKISDNKLLSSYDRNGEYYNSQKKRNVSNQELWETVLNPDTSMQEREGALRDIVRTISGTYSAKKKLFEELLKILHESPLPDKAPGEANAETLQIQGAQEKM